MVEPRRLTELAAAMEQAADLPPGDLVVALSGGADSAALLWLCRRISRPVRALHVHHGLVASDLLAAAARSIAERLEVELSVERVSVPAGSSPENRAREVRYRALLAATVDGEWVLTAHTSDDQAETVVDHLLRGSGLDGLRGIPARRPPIARPILAVSRATTREVASLAGLPWQDDPMNLEPDPLRNRIRTRLLPELERYNRRIRQTLATTARTAARDVEHLEGEVSYPVRIHRDGAALPASVLSTLPPSPAARGARRLLAAAGLEWAPIPAVDGVLAVARGEAGRHEPGAGLAVRRSGALVVVESHPPTPPGAVSLPSAGETRFGEWVFHAYETDEAPGAMPLSAGWMVGDAESLGPLQVEPASDHPAALGHLADARVPAPDREAHPVVVSPSGPVWVPGVRRLPVGWADPATARYLVVRARTERRWQS